MIDTFPAIDTDVMDVQGYLTIANQYVYRGMVEKNPEAALSAALNISSSSGWFLDTWLGEDANYPSREYLSTDEYVHDAEKNENTSNQNVVQADINFGINIPINVDWSTAVSHAWLRHDNDYHERNYQEWRWFGLYRSSLTMQLAYADDYRQLRWRYWNAEVQWAWPINREAQFQFGGGETWGEGEKEFSHAYLWLAVAQRWSTITLTLRGHHAVQMGDLETVNRVEMMITWGGSLAGENVVGKN